jgi:hypothetical protein
MLLEESGTSSDALVHLWALRASTFGFRGVSNLARAIRRGKVDV